MKRFSNILFVASSVTDDTTALTQAAELANNNHASLTVIGIVEASEKEIASPKAKTKQLLEAIVTQQREVLMSVITDTRFIEQIPEIKVLVGKRFLEIVREVVRNKFDLVIKSVESKARLFGSTDMKLVRKCPCPVWVIKPTEQKNFGKIVAALDYDPEESQVDSLNAQILEMAASLAISDLMELHVVHAWRLPHEEFFRSPRSGYSAQEVNEMVKVEQAERRSWLDSLVNMHCSAQGDTAIESLKPDIHLINGNAGYVVPDIVEKLGAELIVMGTVGRTGIPGLLVGNTAEDILSRIQCSVLTVKPKGFISPIS